MGLYALMIIPYLLIFAVPIVMLIWVMVRGLTLPRGLRRGRAAVCGRCAHEIALGADEAQHPSIPHRCPECGRPYLMAGVLTLGLAKKTRPGMAWVIVCWTALSIGFTLVVIGIVSTASYSMSGSFNMDMTFSQTVEAVRTDGAAPTNIPGYSARFDGDVVYAFGSPVSSGSLTITIRPENGPATQVEIDPFDTSWTLPSTGASGPAFDRAAAMGALTAAGVDTSTPFVFIEAGQMADAVQNIQQFPESAVYSVLNPRQNPYVAQTPSTTSTGVATSWYPAALTVTEQTGSSGVGLAFGFESDTVYQANTGSPAVESYDGRVEFSFTTGEAGGSGPALETITLTVRPPEGWPATVVYQPGAGVATITHGKAGSEMLESTPGTHQEAIGELAQIVGLVPEAPNRLDPGLAEIARLITRVEGNPSEFDRTPTSYGGGAPPAVTSANPAGDGQPDGGLMESRPATQSYNTAAAPYQSAALPLAIMISIASCALVWIVGIVGIVLRRYKLYPGELLAQPGSQAEPAGTLG